jgi:hypothetical protein
MVNYVLSVLVLSGPQVQKYLLRILLFSLFTHFIVNYSAQNAQ